MPKNETAPSSNNTCKLETLGKHTIPICGHDVITEFMVQDVKTNPTNGVILYGGLYANDLENQFFWYISTMRFFSLNKIPLMINKGTKVKEYISDLITGERLQYLYEAFEKPLTQEMNDGIDALINLGLLASTKNGTVKITEKGIELCAVFAHLTINHRVKPPPPMLNEIFESFSRSGLPMMRSKEPPYASLTVESVMKQLAENGELERLDSCGIEIQTLQDVIQLYLCPPF